MTSDLDNTPERQGVSVLETKLHRGRMKTGLVSRPHLLQMLERAAHHKLTLISASAGYGKSTLLHQWAGQTKLPVAWLTLDKGDNEPDRFLLYLIKALRPLQPGLGQMALELLQAPQQPPIQELMSGLLNEIETIPADFVLILDDYHLIDNPVIHEALAAWLAYIPTPLHLMMATRTDPPLPLPRLRASGELLELRPADLRFTFQETTRFLNGLMHLDLAAEEVTRLADLTEGWVVGLQLAALALQGRFERTQFMEAFSGNHRYIFDYLADEVFSRQTGEIQQFLLRTVVLERLNGGLVEAVSGQAFGQARLAGLERANLFVIPLDEQQRWYRYHHLFGDFLKRRLEQHLSAEEIAGLHRRAAAWYQTAGLPEEALKHLLILGDFEQMAVLLEQLAPQIWTHGQMHLLRKWTKTLPDTWICSQPHLALAYVSSLIDTSYLDQAEHYLHRIETLHKGEIEARQDLADEVLILHCTIAYFRNDIPTGLSLLDRVEARLPRQNMHLRSLFALNLGSIYAWKGELEKATAYLEEAARSAQNAGSRYLAFLTQGQLSTLQVAWGRLHQAYQNHWQAIRIFEQPLPVTGWVHFSLARLLYEWNRLEEAAYHLDLGLELYRHRENPATLINAIPLKVWLQFWQGDREGAGQTLHQAIEMSLRHPDASLRNRLLARQAELALAQGHLESAQAWAEGQSLKPETIGQQPYEVGRALLSLLIAQGKATEALAFWEPLWRIASAQKQVGQMVQLKIRQALAWQAQGDPKQAWSSLGEALALAQPGGYIRSFVEAGPAVAALLARLAQPHSLKSQEGFEERLAGYAQRLLQAFPPEALEIAKVSPLTPRELEVLALIAAGLTNQQIAGKLVIARGTVKKHIDNMFIKLEVRTRTQAVAQARALGLIP